MSTHDVIIIGGSVDGLATAALLAKAGKDVLLLEARDTHGGLAARRGFHDGFASPGILHDASRLQPEVVTQLNLTAHGLLQIPAPPVLCADGDDDGVTLGKDGPSLDAEEARRYADWRAWVGKVTPVVRSLLDEPAPPIAASLPRLAWPALRLGAALRRLGRRDMMEFLRVPPMCAADWLNEWLEDERLKAAIAAASMQGVWGGPWSAGTASQVLFHQATDQGTQVAGGPAALVEALINATEAAGARLRTGAKVTDIRCKGARVTGVALENGENLEAPVVVSALDPQATFLGLMSNADVPPGLAADLSGWRCRGTTAKVHLAVADAPPFGDADGEPIEHIQTGATLDDVERGFDALKYGAVSEDLVLDIRVPSLSDPTLAPRDHHVISVMAHFVPRDLEGGWTEDATTSLGDSVVARLEELSPGLGDRILAREVVTPADLESELGLSGGHVLHGEPALDQMLSLRPTVSCSGHETPVPGLFLCGPGTHPGGVEWMGSARLATRRVLGL